MKALVVVLSALVVALAAGLTWALVIRDTGKVPFPALTLAQGAGEPDSAFVDRVNARVADTCKETKARKVQVHATYWFTHRVDDQFVKC